MIHKHLKCIILSLELGRYLIILVLFQSKKYTQAYRPTFRPEGHWHVATENIIHIAIVNVTKIFVTSLCYINRFWLTDWLSRR